MNAKFILNIGVLASLLTLCLLASCAPAPTPPDITLDRLTPDLPIFHEGLRDPSILAAMNGAIVYGRGAFFFEDLRDELGSNAFDAFLKDYVGSFAWKIATAKDLKALAEKHCNCDLTPIFEKWVFP